MAQSLSSSLLAAVAALVVCGAASAQNQDPGFAESVRLLRLGQKDAALLKLQEVLAKDPSSEDALSLYQSISQDEWFMLLSEQGEIQKIAQSILDRAKVGKRDRSRDTAAIQALVDAVCANDSTYESRRTATLKLVSEHGEFAVPALVEKLGNADDATGQIHAIAALRDLGADAVLPLIESLKSANPLVRLNGAAALSHLGDARALPAMARLAQLDDHANVKDVAARFLARFKAESRTAGDLYVAEARRYIASGVPSQLYSPVVWTLKDDKLVANDVPPVLYSLELAKACAHDAVTAMPTSADARSLVAQANLAEANVIETSIQQGDESVKPLEGLAGDLKMTALAAGPEVLRAALEEGLSRNLPSVAVGAIRALAASEGQDSIGSPSLIKALDSSDKRIAYAAAEALAKASGGISVPSAAKVVDLLASAVAEEAVRSIQVIDPSNETQAAIRVASGQRNVRIATEVTGKAGMRGLLVDPNVDVVVISEILPDTLPEDVINNVKKDPRMAGMRIVVIAKDVEAAKTRFGDKINGTLQAPITAESLTGAVDAALEGVAVEPRNARAEAFAKSASEALLTMAESKTPIAGALQSLAAQLNRSDAVAIPAAKALGYSGTAEQIDALLAAVSGSGSLELKVAAADSAGMILARMSDCPQGSYDALAAVVLGDGDAKLRTAAATALGRARLSDEAKAKLLDALKKIGGAGNGAKLADG